MAVESLSMATVHLFAAEVEKIKDNFWSIFCPSLGLDVK